jgi:hypothetical protein
MLFLMEKFFSFIFAALFRACVPALFGKGASSRCFCRPPFLAGRHS